MKKILVVGSGGREHAVARAFSRSPKVSHVYVAPGNAGMNEEGISSVEIPLDDIEGLSQFAQEMGVDVTFVGSEQPLEAGIVDLFRKNKQVIVGPSKVAAQLETSKAYAKEVMAQAGVPTASYQYFEADQYKEARAYIKNLDLPIVIKADGLMAGKGVVIAQSLEAAQAALKEMMVDHHLPVLVEEFMEGKEFSYFALVNGSHVIPIDSACDYKRVGEGDQGLNTGGMGAFSPVPWVDDTLEEQVLDQVIRPLAKEMERQGTPYTGVIYAGLMLKDGNLKVIEFNARFGDPETQVMLPRIQTDFYDLIQAHLEKEAIDLKVSPQVGLGVVVASHGYPKDYQTGMAIQIEDKLQPSDIYYSGVKEDAEGNLQAHGGRVLMVTTQEEDLPAARESVYQKLDHLQIDQTFYRKDIGLHRE